MKQHAESRILCLTTLPVLPCRRGGTVVAVLVIMLIVCLLAHQTAKTLFLLRRGQDYQMKVLQAREVLALAQLLEHAYQEDPGRLGDSPLIVQVGSEYAKMEFSSDHSDSGAEITEVSRIVAIWPVDSQGQELPQKVPVTVSLENATQ